MSSLSSSFPNYSQTEFKTGKDHTQEVAEIEKQILPGTNLPVRQHNHVVHC